MAKVKKNTDKKEEEKPVQKKKSKYDITVKTDLSFEELIKMAVNTPLPNKKKKS